MQDDEWPTVRIPAARLEQLEAERDHLAKQHEIYREALELIAGHSIDFDNLIGARTRAKQALKAAEEVGE